MFLFNKINIFSFQSPATPIMEGIIDLHNYIFFYLILVFVFVLWMYGYILYKFYVVPSLFHDFLGKNNEHVSFLKKLNLFLILNINLIFKSGFTFIIKRGIYLIKSLVFRFFIIFFLKKLVGLLIFLYLDNTIPFMEGIISLQNYLYICLSVQLVFIFCICIYLYKSCLIGEQLKLLFIKIYMYYKITPVYIKKIMINKKKPTALSQSVVLVLLGCIVLYTGTFIYEYVFLCDLEKYIHMYDQAARAKCARDGTFFNVQHYEGVYAYWRIQRRVHEGAITLVRVGSIGVFSYILFSLLSPKGDPKGPGSDGGSKPDSDIPLSTLGSSSELNVALVNDHQLLYADKSIENDVMSVLKSRSFQDGFRDLQIGVSNQLQKNVALLDDIRPDNLHMALGSLDVINDRLTQNIPQVSLDFTNLRFLIKEHIKSLKVENPNITFMEAKVAIMSRFSSFMPELQQTRTTKIGLDVSAARWNRLEIYNFLINYRNLCRNTLDHDKNEAIIAALKRYIFFKYQTKYDGIKFSNLSSEEFENICVDLKNIRMSFKFNAKEPDMADIRVTLDFTPEELAQILKNCCFSYKDVDSAILSKDFFIKVLTYHYSTEMVSSIEFLVSKLVIDDNALGLATVFRGFTYEDYLVFLNFIVKIVMKTV